MFACLFLPPVPLSSAAGRSSAAADALVGLAREFSPRVGTQGQDLVVLDISGLDRLLGDAGAIGRELRRAAAERGLAVHVAVAATRSAAMLLACGRSGLTVAGPGEERRLLAGLPLSVLGVLTSTEEHERGSGGGRKAEGGRQTPARSYALRPTPYAFSLSAPHSPLPAVLYRWGLRTLGELAALPSVALSERLGQDGVWWQQLARGEDAGPLVPDRPERRYEASLDLEWPIEGLEPLSFVLGRLFEPLSAELARDDRAAAVLHVTLTLVTRETDTRTLQLPAPMRDPRVLRTLVLLNLESRPIADGIDRITVTAEPAPGRVVQGLLLGRALPVPEQIAPLVARLGALMGDERVGAAALVDSHRPEAFRMTLFSGQWPVVSGQWSVGPASRRPRAQASGQWSVASGQRDTRDSLITDHRPLTTVVRRFRLPVPARVQVEDGAPVRVVTDRAGLQGGRVERSAGPWRTSGEWWQLSDARLQPRADGRLIQVGWNRDEWDVALGDGGVYRLYRDRDRNRWFVDGIVD